jgi:hypothetical protein
VAQGTVADLQARGLVGAVQQAVAVVGVAAHGPIVARRREWGKW